MCFIVEEAGGMGVWKSEDDLQALLLHHVGHKTQIQVTRLGGLYL